MTKMIHTKFKIGDKVVLRNTPNNAVGCVSIVDYKACGAVYYNVVLDEAYRWEGVWSLWVAEKDLVILNDLKPSKRVIGDFPSTGEKLVMDETGRADWVDTRDLHLGEEWSKNNRG